MKSSVLVIAGLAVLSTSAFASKARMEALGQGSTSYYINDSRSVFLNPAALNNNKNYVVTEWGTGASADASNTPRAEGGFFREMGAFSYGLYLGNNSSRIAPSTTGGATRAFKTQSNALDLVLAGDMGMMWGARLHYAGLKDETGTFASGTGTTKHSGLGLGLGIVHGDLDASLNMDLADKSTGTNGAAGVVTDKSEQKPSFTLNVGYNWMGNKFYGMYSADKREDTLATLVTTKNTDMRIGVGRTHEVNPTARVFTDLALDLATSDVSGTGKSKTNIMPLTIGLETDATSWLVLRGSVKQNVILGETKSAAGKTSSVANSTTVNAGATLNFGKLTVDGVIGNTASARNGALGTSNTGVLATDNLMSRVGVTYKF